MTWTEFFSKLEVIIPTSIAGGTGIAAIIFKAIKELLKIWRAKSETFKTAMETIHELTAEEKEAERKNKKAAKTKSVKRWRNKKIKE